MKRLSESLDQFGMPISEVTLTLGSKKADPGALDSFMSEYHDATVEHPLDSSRIWNGAVSSELSPFSGRIHISWVQALTQKSGAGTQFMEWLCSLADKHHVSLQLVPEPRGEGAMSVAKLKAFYSRFGFKSSSGGSDKMIREPK